MRLVFLLGYYNYTVIATYVELCVSFLGILQAWNGRTFAALMCLMLSGTLDAFDGKIARTKKDRTEEEKRFGIQLDSLCDIVSFGVLPGVICRSMGMTEALPLAICCLYLLCAQIRLAYFNVQEEERQSRTSENRHVYSGLPVTSVCILLPPAFLFHLISDTAERIAVITMMLVMAVLFISPIRIPKPGKVGIPIVLGVGVLEFFLLLLTR